MNDDGFYTYYINNHQTALNQYLIFGLRELSAREMANVCSNQTIDKPPITNERIPFTSNYQLRIYSSACYYLDQNNQWQSDGLLVSLTIFLIK